MMPQYQDFQYVKLPNGEYGKFLATASDAQIRAAIEKDFPDAYKPKAEQRFPMNPAVSPITTGGALKEEVGGIGDVLKGLLTQNPAGYAYQGVKQALETRTPAKWEERSKAQRESWKQEYEQFKADPYAYLLRAAPRVLGQAAGAVLTGKALPEIPGLVSKLSRMRPETAAARLTERLAPMTEGEPTAELVKRVAPGLKITGKESMFQVANAAKGASAKVTAIEDGILKTPYGNSTIGETPVPAGQGIAQELRKLSDPNTTDFDPRLAKAIETRAKQYDGAKLTPNRLQKRLKTLTKQGDAMYGRSDIEAALASHDPKLAFLKAETNAVRNAYYDALEKLSGQDMRPLKQMQSDLIGLQKAVVRPLGKEAQEAASAKAHPILGAKDSLRRKVLKSSALAAGAGAGGYGGYKATRMFLGR